MIPAHRLLCCCLPLLCLSTAGIANPAVTAGFQLAPYSGFNLGLEWKDSPQFSYAVWISQGRISLGSEKGEALGITGGIKYFPFESSLYLFSGLNVANYEFTDDDPSNTGLSKTENSIEAQTLEIMFGNQWQLSEQLQLDFGWIGFRWGRSHEVETSVALTGSQEETENKTGSFSRLTLLKTSLSYWF